MSKPISLFSGYSQKENRVTNYVLLTLRLLYEESPGYLNQVFGELFPDEISNAVGVTFHQQVKKSSSIPDGFIAQKALSIYVEAKNHDWFYDSQLEKHLEALNREDPGLKMLMLLGNIESDLESRFETISETVKEKYSESLHFQVVTFEDLLAALNTLDLPKKMQDSISELEYFFNEENLLPKWKEFLDVVNCTGSIEEVQEHGVYFCPTSGGSYSHKRCMYFGACAKKVVSFISKIHAVVDVDSDGGGSLKWKNSNESESSVINQAIELAGKLRPSESSVRVFLLGERVETYFEKDTKGGMLQSKLYFDIAQLEFANIRELAEQLTQKVWSDIR